jgi:hypothetical protein
MANAATKSFGTKQKKQMQVVTVPTEETRKVENESLAIKTEREESWSVPTAVSATKSIGTISLFESRAGEEDQKRSIAVESRAPVDDKSLGTTAEPNTTEDKGLVSGIISDLFQSNNAANGLESYTWSAFFMDKVEEKGAQDKQSQSDSEEQIMSPMKLAEIIKQSVQIDGNIDSVAKVFQTGMVSDLFRANNAANGLESSTWPVLFKDKVEEKGAQDKKSQSDSEEQIMSPMRLAEYIKQSIQIDGDIDSVAKVFQTGAVASGLGTILEGSSFISKEANPKQEVNTSLKQKVKSDQFPGVKSDQSKDNFF